jgi:hypothetical protein
VVSSFILHLPQASSSKRQVKLQGQYAFAEKPHQAAWLPTQAVNPHHRRQLAAQNPPHTLHKTLQ